MPLPDSGKFLSQNGLKELIKLIKAADATKLENVELNGTALEVTNNSVNITNATPYVNEDQPGSAGLLSAMDKKAINEMTSGSINTIQVDGVDLAKTSGIVNIPLAASGANPKDGAMSSEDKEKLDGIEDGAQENDIETITLGGNSTTIINKNVNIPLATQSIDGLLSKEDKKTLDDALQGVNLNGSSLTVTDNEVDINIKRNGTLVTLTSGAVDINVPIEIVKQNGTALTPDSTNAVNIEADKNTIETIYIGSKQQTPDSNKKIILDESSSSQAGVMTAAQYTKLAGIEDGAEVNIVEGVKFNGSALTVDSDRNILITAETEIIEDATKDDKLATIGAIKDYTDTHSKIETIKENGTALTITDKAVDITVPYMELYQTVDGTTQTKITPDGSHKGVINMSALIPKTDIQSDFSQAISDTNKVAQAKAIKEYVDSKAHLSFQILGTTTTDDIYYSKDASGNITIHVKSGITPSTSIIYLVPESGSYGSYIEYFYDATKGNFEEFGRTSIDLSNYVKYSDVATFSTSEIDTLWNNPTV